MFETVLTVVLGAVLLVALAAFGLLWLLARQVARRRPLLTLLLVLAGFATLPAGIAFWLAAAAIQLRPAPAAPAKTRRGGVPLQSPWSGHVRDVRSRLRRYDECVAQIRPGPLRDRLEEVRDDVRAVVAEAERVARDGDRLQRICRDVERAARRHGSDDPAVRASVAAQRESAARLRDEVAARRRRLARLVAGLDEVIASSAGMTALQDGGSCDVAALTDRVAALRDAALETLPGYTLDGAAQRLPAPPGSSPVG